MPLAKALVFSRPGQVDVLPVEVPDPGPGQVLCETLASVVSPGTELRALRGEEADCFPFVAGYSNVGRVIARGEGVDLPLGTVVAVGTTEACGLNRLWGGHISHTVRTAAGLRVVPAGLPAHHAALVTIAAISHRGVAVCPSAPGEHVVVVGLGAIGLLAALFHQLRGARVIAFNRSAGRVARARALGLDAHTYEGSLADAYATLNPAGADIVVDATGAASVLAETLRLGRSPQWNVDYAPRTRFVVLGSYGEQPLTFGYRDPFIREYEMHFPRLSCPADHAACFDALTRGQLPADEIIAGPFAPEQAPEVFRRLREDHDAVVTAAFRWAE